MGFVVSTYGDGDPPDNTHGLLSTLRALRAGESAVSNLSYALFGLGNSNYRLFNKVALDLDAMLQDLGAKRLGRLGYGDDAHGETEANFLSWRRGFENAIMADWSLSEQPRNQRQLTFKMEEISDDAAKGQTMHVGEPAASRVRRLPGQPKDTKSASALNVQQIRRLWESSDRLCLEIDVDLGSNRFIKYQTGDHMAIWASNPNHEVNRILSALDLAKRRHTAISISFASGRDSGQQLPVPSPTTIEALLRYYLEICGPLSQETVSALTDYAPSKSARDFLAQITTDGAVFKTRLLSARMTLADVLDSAAGAAVWQIPISFLLERLKPMQPRYYSISSSVMAEPRKASLAVVVRKRPLREAVHDEPTSFRGCYGLATEYLCALERVSNGRASIQADNNCVFPSFDLAGPLGVLGSSKLFGRMCRSAFKLPPKASTPIILIGAGTGVAPFRAFLQERARQKDVLHEVGKTLLFMGFRHSDVDFLHKDDWESFEARLGRSAFKYWTAFSRDEGRERQKHYVQDVLAQHTDEIMEIMEESFASRIYICGSAQMARDVTRTLAVMRCRYTDQEEESCALWVKTLRESNRLLEDVWS